MEVGGKRHAPLALLPGKNLGTLCTGDWVGPMARLDWCGEEIISAPTKSVTIKVWKCADGGTRTTNVFWEPQIEFVIIPYAWCNLSAFIN